MKFGKHTSQALKDFFLALSLANLLMIDPWTRVLGLSAGDVFYRRIPPTRMDIVGVVIAVLFLTAAFWSVTTVVRELRSAVLKSAIRTIFLLLALQSFYAILIRTSKFWWLQNALHNQYEYVAHLAPRTTAVLLAIALMALVGAIIRWGRQLSKVAIPAVMLEIPFVFIMFLQAGGMFVNYRQFALQFQDQPAIAANRNVKAKAHSRVVWLLFDELDQGMVGSKDPFRIPTPQIDRLKAESMVATNAVSPAFCTRLSVPAYITGHQITDMNPSGVRAATMTLASNGQTIAWDSQDNLFAQAISEGFTTGIVGWYLPYCRILKNSFNYCWWAPMYSNSLHTGDTVADDILTQMWNAADAVPLGSILLKKIDKRAHCEHRVWKYEQILAHARQEAVDPAVDLLFVHFPIPHPPGFYNAALNQFDCDGDYVDNVSLVDVTIGKLRSAMTAARTWDDTIVIISSDHPYRRWLWGSINQRDRKENHDGESALYARVPLFVKLAHQHTGTRYTRPINTIILHDLVLTALRGSFDEPAELANWIAETGSVKVAPVSASACMPFSDSSSSASDGDTNHLTSGDTSRLAE